MGQRGQQTGSGKLDRRALPSLDMVRAPIDLVAPLNDMERDLQEIWQDVLGIEQIGTTDDLFALGADSLSIFRIAARTLDRGLGIEARHLLEFPTIKSVAEFAKSQSKKSKAPSLKDFRKGAARRAAVAS